jgi:ribosomal-protein-alanine N-acetyltransferase
VPEAPHWGEAEYLVAMRSEGVPRCLLVAEVDRKLTGFAVGMVCGEMGELESVAVGVDSRRLGVGRALCEAVLEWCREMGAEVVELEVRAGGLGAIALYEGLGFVVTGGRRGYYREPVEDAVLMGLRVLG